jgi:hypothetical protein
MGHGHGKRAWVRFAAALVLVSVLTMACADVEVVDTTPAPDVGGAFISPLPAGGPRHDLAVMAVEFDPALNYQQLILRRKSVSLLVVVENTGTASEHDVVVRAELTSPQDAKLAIIQEAGVERIAPGEIRIVRFGQLGEIPIRDVYHLEVAVVPVAGETALGNNRKAFDVQIHRK